MIAGVIITTLLFINTEIHLLSRVIVNPTQPKESKHVKNNRDLAASESEAVKMQEDYLKTI